MFYSDPYVKLSLYRGDRDVGLIDSLTSTTKKKVRNIDTLIIYYTSKDYSKYMTTCTYLLIYWVNMHSRNFSNNVNLVPKVVSDTHKS